MTATATFTRSPLGGTFTVASDAGTVEGFSHGQAWHLLTEELGFSARVADRALAEAKSTGAEVLAVFPIADDELAGKAIVVRTGDPTPGSPDLWVVAEVAPGREDRILASSYLSIEAVAKAVELAGWSIVKTYLLFR